MIGFCPLPMIFLFCQIGRSVMEGSHVGGGLRKNTRSTFYLLNKEREMIGPQYFFKPRLLKTGQWKGHKEMRSFLELLLLSWPAVELKIIFISISLKQINHQTTLNHGQHLAMNLISSQTPLGWIVLFHFYRWWGSWSLKMMLYNMNRKEVWKTIHYQKLSKFL